MRKIALPMERIDRELSSRMVGTSMTAEDESGIERPYHILKAGPRKRQLVLILSVEPIAEPSGRH